MITFDSLEQKGGDFYKVTVNNQVRYTHHSTSDDLYSTFIYDGDVITIESNYPGDYNIVRKDYTTDDQGGDNGIRNVLISNSVAVFSVTFTATTVPEDYSFRYIVSLTNFPVTPTPTPTITPTFTVTPTNTITPTPTACPSPYPILYDTTMFQYYDGANTTSWPVTGGTKWYGLTGGVLDLTGVTYDSSAGGCLNFTGFTSFAYTSGCDNPDTQITMGGWINISETSGTARLFANGAVDMYWTTNNDIEVSIWWRNSVNPDQYSTQTIQMQNPLTPGQWYYVVIVLNIAVNDPTKSNFVNLDFYVNGQHIVQQKPFRPANYYLYAFLGCRISCGQNFKGLIGDFEIYIDNIITSVDIAYNYNAKACNYGLSPVYPVVSVTQTPTPSVTPTFTPTPSITPTLTRTPTLTPTNTVTPTVTTTPGLTSTPTPTVTPSQGSTTFITSGLTMHNDANNNTSYPSPYTGSTWFDISGNQFDTTLFNSPSFISSGTPKYFDFDGIDDYTLSETGATLTGSNSVTFSTWVRYSSNTSDGLTGLFLQGNLSTNWGLRLELEGTSYSGKFVAGAAANYLSGGTVAGVYAYSTDVPSGNTWYNLTGVWRSGTSLKLYVNGVLNSTTTTTRNNIRAGTPLARWSTGYYNAIYYNIDVGLQYVYNRALSDSEVLQNYNATKSNYGY